MNIVTGVDFCMVTGMMASTPQWAIGGSVNTLLVSPLSKKVNEMAIDCYTTDNGARVIQCLQYFAKPIDCLIQAVVYPVFGLIETAYCFKKLSDEHEGITRTVLRVIFIVNSPLIAMGSLILSTCFSVNLIFQAAFQIIVPFKAIYHVYYGKEAARAFFDYQAHLYAHENDLMYPIFKSVKRINDVSFVILPPQTLTPYNELYNNADFPADLLKGFWFVSHSLPVIRSIMSVVTFWRPSLIQLWGRAVLVS